MPGVVALYSGMTMSADAKQNAAEEQLQQAQKAASFAVPTQEEMTTLDNQITLYQNSYSSSQAQLSQLQNQVTNTYGSSIVEAGKQLLTQLQGGQSAQTQAAQAQVDRQKQQMQAQLTQQLGPGAMSTSAGIQAMANFNFQANQYMTNVGTQSVNNLVNQLGSLQGSQSGSVNDILNVNKNLTGMLGQIQQTQFNLQQRQVNAQMGITQYEGADQVGAATIGNDITQLVTGAAGMAGQMAGQSQGMSAGGMGGSAGGSSTASAPSSPIGGGASALTMPTLGSQFGSSTAAASPSLGDAAGLAALTATPTNNSSIRTTSLGNGSGDAGSFNSKSLTMGNM